MECKLFKIEIQSIITLGWTIQIINLKKKVWKHIRHVVILEINLR